MSLLSELLLRVIGKIFPIRLGKTRKEIEYLNRYSSVRNFLMNTLPEILGEETLLIEGGRYNYFIEEDGQFPKIDFVLPELGLFIIVGNRGLQSWELASRSGVKKEEWEKEMSKLSRLEMTIKALSKISRQPAKLMVIRWDDPISGDALRLRFTKELETDRK